MRSWVHGRRHPDRLRIISLSEDLLFSLHLWSSQLFLLFRYFVTIAIKRGLPISKGDFLSNKCGAAVWESYQLRSYKRHGRRTKIRRLSVQRVSYPFLRGFVDLHKREQEL